MVEDVSRKLSSTPALKRKQYPPGALVDAFNPSDREDEAGILGYIDFQLFQETP